MDIRIHEPHYRWIDTPSESFILDEVPNPEPPPHPQPTDPPPTAALIEDGGEPGDEGAAFATSSCKIVQDLS